MQVTPTPRKTRFQLLVKLYWTGFLTRKVPMKGFKVVIYISFPFPKLCLAQSIDRGELGDASPRLLKASFAPFMSSGVAGRWDLAEHGRLD